MTFSSWRWVFLLARSMLRLAVFLISIKLNTCSQYVLNPNIEIPTMHDILLFRVMLCAIILFFGATYTITLFIDSFFCVSNICSDYFRTLSVWNRKTFFFKRLYSWLSFCLQRNSSSLSLYIFPSSDALVLKHHSALQFSWQLNMCSRGTLLAALNSSIVFPYSFKSCTPNPFWVGEHLLWCTHISEPYYHWSCKICAWTQP